MATATKICKVCGKEYPYCRTVFKPGVFRYQDVACSPEHGAIYLAKVEAARTEPKSNENDASELPDDIEALRKIIIAEAIEDEDEDIDEDGEEDED